jgi:hypothetical protein
MHYAPKLTYISNKKQDYLLHYVPEDNLYSMCFSKENISGSNVNYSYTLVPFCKCVTSDFHETTQEKVNLSCLRHLISINSSVN